MAFWIVGEESWCIENLPKTAFPLLLYKLFHHLKPENLVSGFRATSIVPLERNEVSKRLPGAHDTTNVNEFSFNQSVLGVFKENCGAGQKKQEKRKRQKQIEPGKQVRADNLLSEDEENENQHLQNGKHKRKGKFQEQSTKMKMRMCGFVNLLL